MKPSDDSLIKAGTLLLHAALNQTERDAPAGASKPLTELGYKRLLEVARRHFNNASLATSPQRYLAVKTALEAAEAELRGGVPPYSVEIFDSCVEGVLGGERPYDFGGVKIGNKISTRRAYMQAAVYVLWSQNIDRDRLAEDAKQMLGLQTRQKVAKLISNIKTNHLSQTKYAPHPAWEHMDRVTELVERHGCCALSDF